MTNTMSSHRTIHGSFVESNWTKFWDKEGDKSGEDTLKVLWSTKHSTRTSF